MPDVGTINGGLDLKVSLVLVTFLKILCNYDVVLVPAVIVML